MRCPSLQNRLHCCRTVATCGRAVALRPRRAAYPACINSVDILKIFDNLKPKQSVGHDNLSMAILKKIAPHISSPLALVINQSLNTGIFHSEPKIALVNPVYKKGDKHIFDNYRPISLLPALSKLFEKIVYNQLSEYFNKKKLFYKSQYGFRKHHSTEFACLEFIDRTLHELDKGEFTISIFIDLSKAFDTLDHSILLYRLLWY